MTAKAEKLLQEATTSTWHIKNTVEVKNEVWLLCMKIWKFCRQRLVEISQTCDRQ